MKYFVRWMGGRDLSKVVSIENACFEYPWTDKQIVSCLQQRNTIGMVVELDNDIAGYMIYDFQSDRLQLLNIAVDIKHQKTGVGRAMIEKLISKLSPDRRTQVFAPVRETNVGAQLFFKKMGFLSVEILKNYYEIVEEDTYMMRYSIKKSFNWTNRITKFVEAENE